MKRIKLATGVLLIASLLTATTGCLGKGKRDKFDYYVKKPDGPVIYLDGNPEELADDVFDLIMAADSYEDYKELAGVSYIDTKVMKKITSFDEDDIDDVECVGVWVDIKSEDESKNGCSYYAIEAAYSFELDDEDMVCDFYFILVDEYEWNNVGVAKVELIDADEYNGKSSYTKMITPDEVEDHPVMEFIKPVKAEHHKKVCNWDEHQRVPESIELMEEILYCLEEEDDDELIDLYSEENVNGKGDLHKQAKEEVKALMHELGGEDDLEARGRILNFKDYSLKPTYIDDADDIDHPHEYIMRYIVDADGEEVKVQVVYISAWDDTTPDELVGIQSISIISED